uniref:Uncharacterized protein n=1 Tax=Setaria digitata TaxID=48799 RepID=A0A915PL57_9BILA
MVRELDSSNLIRINLEKRICIKHYRMFPWRRELTKQRRLYILQRIRLILISGRCSWAQLLSNNHFEASLIAAERRAYEHGRTFETYVCLIFIFTNDEIRRRIQNQQQQQQQQMTDEFVGASNEIPNIPRIIY